MGQRHSRTKAPHKAVPVATAVRPDARLIHDSHPRKKAPTKSHRWRNVRRPKSPLRTQPESARCTIVNAGCTNANQPASLIEPQSLLFMNVGRTASLIEREAIPEPAASSVDHLSCRTDSLGPLEIPDGLTRDSSPCEQAKETPTASQVQAPDPSSAPAPKVMDILEPFQADITQNEQVEQTLTNLQVHIQHPPSARSPAADLTQAKPQAASSLPNHNPEVSVDGQLSLSEPRNQPVIQATKECQEEHLVALRTPTNLQPVEAQGIVAEAALDYAMAVSLQEEEDRRHAAEPPTPSRDCSVCCDSLHALDFPAKPPSSECAHAADVCFSCLQQWVATKVDANARAVIDCPRCTTLLSHEDVRRACNFETFAKYDRFAALTVVNDLQNFHWCLRPGCGAGQEHVGGHLGYMQCYACDFEQCLKHKMEWHRDQTCRQYDARIRTDADKRLREQEERETTKFMDEQQIKVRLRKCPDSRCGNRIPEGEGIPKWCPKRGCKASLEREPVWKKCPACHTLIEKTYGCDQVKCTVSMAASLIF